MLKQWLIKRKDEKRKKAEEEKRRLNNMRTRAFNGLAKFTEEILSKECPIADKKCFEECVHFNVGCVKGSLSERNEVTFWIIKPKCMLWK